MCTAITYKTKDVYFGRTLDIECSYGEEVIVTPRHFAFDFRHTGEQNTMPSLEWELSGRGIRSITRRQMNTGWEWRG